MPCGACRRVLSRKGELLYDERRKYDSFMIHHQNVESLRHAAEDEKCSICHKLWTNLSPEVRQIAVSKGDELHDRYKYATKGMIEKNQDGFEWEESKASFIVSKLKHSVRHVVREEGPWDLYLSSCNKFKELLGETTSASYKLYSEKVLNTIPRIERLHLNSTAFPDTKALASKWLEQCCASHTSCNDDYDRQGWNPTRLLDLNELSNGTVHLVDETSAMGALTYVTLSHRWGDAQFLQLTRTTETHLKRGIQLLELPKTFQHAIQVTRELGYRYLWIDSLCIKQDRDDLSDWLREASLMHKVYRHGHFNISATGAMDTSKGLYVSRDETAQGYERVDLMVEGLTGGSTPCIAFDSTFWTDNVLLAPLNTRGWVLQERILSKRVLHFGKSQLLWECRELNAAETFPDGMPWEHPPHPGIKCMDPAVSGAWMRRIEGNYRDPKFWAHDLWSGIATAYARCSLTHSGDKMPAIMGLAKHMSGLVQDEYVAGMWRKYLASELAWRVATDQRQASRHETYRAPSWSWASLNGDVYCQTVSDTGLRLSIKDVRLEYATSEKTGPLKGGFVHVECILRRAEINRKPERDPSETGAWELVLPDSKVGLVDDVVYLDVPPENFDQENEEGSLFCIEVLDDTEYWATLDLMLLRCEDREKGVFSRLGMCSAHDSRKKLLSDKKRVSELPCMSWNPAKKMHTICLI